MAKFSKRHYQFVAEKLFYATQWESSKREQETIDYTIRRLAEVFADEFECDNERFNREHFLAVVRGERPINSRPPRS